MTDRELLQMALDALELLARYENPSTKVQVRKPRDGGPIVTMYPHKVATEAAVPLRARLAQPEPEPVAWKDAPTKIYLQICDDIDCDLSFEAHDDVSWCQDKINDCDIPYVRADIAPQREWVSLTDDELHALHYELKCAAMGATSTIGMYRILEKALREKNNAS